MTSVSHTDGVGRRVLMMAAVTASVVAAASRTSMSLAQGGTDPLPSWTDGKVRQAILDFVARVTHAGSADFVPPADRIAVFDNDGTLWVEDPVPFQLAYALDTLKQMAAANPALGKDRMVQAALKGDLATLLAGPHTAGLMHIIALTHAGMTTNEFRNNVEKWVATARHPRFDKLYIELTYQPMQELLRYMRANGFKTVIVSGGGADFMRVWSERVYGVPPEQVVGSAGLTRYELRPSGPVLIKTLDSLFVDDGPGKPVGIHEFIGRRPIAAFGNSDGDREMLEYTTIGNPNPSLGLIVHHTDAEREYAYDAKPQSTGKLVAALDEAPHRGWLVVDMKHDWKKVFSFEQQEPARKWTGRPVFCCFTVARVFTRPPLTRSPVSNLHDVAAAQLAVDGEVEQSSVSKPSLAVEPRTGWPKPAAA